MSPLLPAAPANVTKASETRERAPAYEGFRELVAGEKRSANREVLPGPEATAENPGDELVTGPEQGDDSEASADTKVSARMFALSHKLDEAGTGAAGDGRNGNDEQSGPDDETANAEDAGLSGETGIPAARPDVLQPVAPAEAADEPVNAKAPPPPREPAVAATVLSDAADAGEMQEGAQALAGLGEFAVARKEQRGPVGRDAVTAKDVPSDAAPGKRNDVATDERLMRGIERRAEPGETRLVREGGPKKDDGPAARASVSSQPAASTQPQADPAAARPAVPTGVAFSIVEAVRNNANWSAFLKAPTAQYREMPHGQGQTLQAIKVQLHPAELGTLTLNLRATGNRISVDIKAEEHAAHKLVAGGLDTVARSFQTLGYQVDQVNLASADGRSDSLGQWGGNRERGETDGRRQDAEYANQAARDDRAMASNSADEVSSSRAGGGRTLYI